MGVREVVHREYIDDERGFHYAFMPIERSIQVKEIADGYVVGYLVQDENYESPDTWGGGTFLVHYHRDFWVADDVITKDVLCAWYRWDCGMEGYKKPPEEIKPFWIFPVAAYIHGGVALALGEGRDFPDYRWDVSHVGAICVAKKEYRLRKSAFKAAENLLETWNQYLCGDVYGCVIERYTKDKERVSDDSVWGFYGHKYALSELERELAAVN